MAEGLEPVEGWLGSDINGDIVKKQYEGFYGLNANIRLNIIDKFVVDGRDLRREMVDSILLPANGLVVDIGCSDGALLFDLYRRRGYQGRALGVDIDSASIENAQKTAQGYGLNSLNFKVGSMDRLEVSDNSIESMICSFAIYHANNPTAVLQNVYRQLTPGGQLILSTNSQFQKQLHQKVLTATNTTLGHEAYEPFATRFSKEVAPGILNQIFDSVQERPQVTEMHFKTEDMDWFMQSLISYFSISGWPVSDAKEWRETAAQITRSLIEPEIQSKGYFSENIDRAFYICRKAG